MKRKLVGRLLLVWAVVCLLSSSSLAFEVVAEEEFSYQQVTSLEVSGNFCDVEIIGNDQSGIDFKGKIVESGFRLGGNYQIEYQNEGGKVRVKVVVKDKSLGFGQLKGKLKFFIPQQLTGKLEINSDSGDVTVQDLAGNISSSSISGDVELENIEGRLNLETTSGDIDGTTVLLTEDSYLETTSGDIKIDFQNDLSELSFNLISTSGRLRAGSLDSKQRLMIDRGKIMVKGESTSGNQEYY